MFKILLYFHILCGITALITGTLAFAYKKGSPKHNKSGKIYGLAMFGIFVTCIPLALHLGNKFLLCFGLLSFYLVYSGVRYTKRKQKAFSLMDKAANIIMIGVASWMTYYTSLYFYNGYNYFAGVIMGGFAMYSWLYSGLDFAKIFLKKESRFGKMDWYYSHMTRMTGAFVTTVVAFLVTNLQIYVPETFLWVIPISLGTCYVLYHIAKKDKKGNSSKVGALLVGLLEKTKLSKSA